MKDQNIELPPLPYSELGGVQPNSHAARAMEKWGRTAIEADRKRRGEPVAYLDLGVGGYMDLGTDLTDEQLAALPKGRHMLAIVGTYGVDGYTEAAPQPDEPAESLGSVGEAGPMPGTSGFTMACFRASEVPVGTKLYTAPQPAEPSTDPIGYLLPHDLERLRKGKHAWICEGPEDGAVPVSLGRVARPEAEIPARGPHIQQPYTLAEIEARLASNDYGAEHLLQHAMLLLRKQPIVPEPLDYSGVDERYANGWNDCRAEMIASGGTSDGQARRDADLLDNLAHELWAAAQRAPGEGIEDAAERIRAILTSRLGLLGLPPLNDAMRAVLRNERCVYGSEDELWEALGEAARS